MDIRKIIKEEIGKVIKEESSSQEIVGLDILNHFPFSELSDTRDVLTRDVEGWGSVQLPTVGGEDSMTQILAKTDITGNEYQGPKMVHKFSGYIDAFKSRYGEEPVFILNPSAPWFAKVKVINPSFVERRKEYSDSKGETLKSWGTTNESGVTDNIVDKKTMDTPTGTLFIMDMGESDD
jgi:hypothetical protein